MYSPVAGIPCTDGGLLLVDTSGKTTGVAFKEDDCAIPRARSFMGSTKRCLTGRSPLYDSVRLDLPHVFR